MPEKTKPKKWSAPAWMEPYLPIIMSTGGNDVAELMNDRTTNIHINAPRAMICVAVKSQVSLLEVLHEKGMLK